MYEEYGRRIRQKLGDSHSVYLILSSKYLEMIKKDMEMAPLVLFRLEGFHQTPEDELIVVTQPGKEKSL